MHVSVICISFDVKVLFLECRVDFHCFQVLFGVAIFGGRKLVNYFRRHTL